jgi:hypothetical protein
MKETWLMVLVVVLFLLRPLWLWQLWRAPLKQGEGWFLGLEVEPGFYRQAGAVLLRRYRAWMAVPLGLESLILLGLILSGQWVYALYEHFLSVVLLIAWATFTTYQFMTRVRLLAPAASASPVTSVQLSLAPRRLRDYTNWRVETAIIGLTLLTLFWMAAQWLGWLPAGTTTGQPSARLLKTMVFFLYLQAGVLLLKQLFVRWRMLQPPRRAEDYRRWRAAWLTYHLRVFDALRLLLALVIWGLFAFKTFKQWWGFARVNPIGLALALASIMVYTLYLVRQQRRLAAVAREIKPLELIKEYPPMPVAEGRFLAGGLLYLNRDNPAILARSPQGLAINLANRSTYLWVAYLSGLVWLVVWQVSH